MLDSSLIQHSLASLRAAAPEHEKNKKEANKTQEAIQNKINNDVARLERTVTATDQDSNPQKVLDQEEENTEKKAKAQQQDEKKSRPQHGEILRDKNKGTIVDITC